MNTQPEALRLADLLDKKWSGWVADDELGAAAELRRLHDALAASETSDAESVRMYRAARDERDRLAALNAQMLDALRAISWSYDTEWQANCARVAMEAAGGEQQ